MAKTDKDKKKKKVVEVVKKQVKRKKDSDEWVVVEKPKAKQHYKDSGKVIGSALGGYFGERGSRYGGMAGKLLGKILGMGSYRTNQDTIQHNSLFKKGDSIQIPAMHSNRHYTRVTQREYIGDVIASSGSAPTPFSLNSYDINPGLGNSFPWLSQIAQNYESYQFLGLVFEFKSTSGESVASANTALGTVVMAASYNAANANFVNKMQMENYEGAISSKPSECIMYGFECDPKENVDEHLYIRNNSVPSGQDQRLYDVGNFQIATVGMPNSSTNLGELWVSYDILLFAPKIFTGQLGYGINYAHYVSSTSVTTSNYFGTDNGKQQSASNIALTLAATTITFPANIVTGNYVIIYNCTQGSATGVGPSMALTSGCSALNLLNNDAFKSYTSPSATVTNVTSYYFITITAPSAQLTLSGGTLGTVSWMDLIVSQINGLSN